MTQQEAKVLCIKKWEIVVANDGKEDPDLIAKELPEVKDFVCQCAYCEKYDIDFDNCNGCPLALGTRNGYPITCKRHGHPFNIWWLNHSEGNAQAVLDLIKSTGNVK